MKKIINILIILPISLFAQNFYEEKTLYEYDDLNRLSKVVFSNGINYEYSYDQLGNRLSKTIGLYLPFNNYQVNTIGLTCINSNDGNLTITAEKKYDYTVTIVGTDNNYSEAFVLNESIDWEINLDTLDGGEYTITITVDGIPQDQYKKVFIINLDEPEPLEATNKSSGTNGKFTVDINKGTAPYTIRLNGNIIATTDENSYSFNASNGDTLEVETAKACEGKYSEVLNVVNGVMLYPNATEGELFIAIPNLNEFKNLQLEIYDMSGRMVERMKPEQNDFEISILIDHLPTGIYIIKIPALNNQSYKVIKR
jgi:YD repeat-containing protein